jgi:hypothetical protein
MGNGRPPALRAGVSESLILRGSASTERPGESRQPSRSIIAESVTRHDGMSTGTGMSGGGESSNQGTGVNAVAEIETGFSSS